MTITASDIIALVDAGVPVHWSNDGYVVEHWPINDEYVIRCVHNDHSIGLTWADGETLNGRPEEFYADIPPDHPLLARHPNGSYHCNQCSCLVILFDDDTHTCTIEHWVDAQGRRNR